ncbi:MAG: RluA family pseudouridine synthase [Chloroflexi bacterium]|nr:RluA family pseudouridine synthase [Chloroflexota bacterium]
MQRHEATVGPEGADQRLDRYLAQLFPDLSRSRLQRLIADGRVWLEGKQAKASTRLEPGQHVMVEIPPPEPLTLQPETIPISVVYEDDDILVVNKPAGLVVHPAPGHPTHTLVNALLALGVAPTGDPLRPGIVHRLDKDTSGLMVVAKHESAHANLAQQLQDRSMAKRYLLVVRGRFSTRRGVIEAPIGRDPRDRKAMAISFRGREARTRFQVLEELGEYTMVEATLETGRTHQLRVHFQSIGHPILGDRTYGVLDRTIPLGRQFVHSWRLGLTLPSTGEWREFEAELPDDLQQALEGLRGRVPKQSEELRP